MKSANEVHSAGQDSQALSGRKNKSIYLIYIWYPTSRFVSSEICTNNQTMKAGHNRSKIIFPSNEQGIALYAIINFN